MRRAILSLFVWLLSVASGCGGDLIPTMSVESGEEDSSAGEPDVLTQRPRPRPRADVEEQAEAAGEDSLWVEDAPVEPDLPAQVVLDWAECDTSDFSGAYPSPGPEVRCAYIEVPYDHDDPGGATVSLRLARQESPGTTDAIFFLAGGPGGSAVEQSGIMPMLMGNLVDQFDLVYLDQRGTGGSGYLTCSKGYPYNEYEWEACATEHEGASLTHYLTLDAARDLEYVRKALGYDKLNMRGGSYGTRLALEYLRQFPEHAGMVVLDGAAPPDTDLFGMVVDAPDLGIEWLAAECEYDTGCLQVSPNLVGDLWTRRGALAEDPRPIMINGMNYLEDEQLFVDALIAALYSAKTRYLVPRAIHNAVTGNNKKWNQVLSYLTGAQVKDAADRFDGPAEPYPSHRFLPLGGLNDSPVSPAMFALVACSEWFPQSGGMEVLEAKLAHSEWAGSEPLDTAATCDQWARPVDEQLADPVYYPDPVLLISGQYDLNTFASLADHAAKTLPQGTHVVVPYATHSALITDCGAEIIESYFLEGGEIDQVDLACLQHTKHKAW